MEGRSPLELEIRRRIAAAGAMPVAEYVALCLFDAKHAVLRNLRPVQQWRFHHAPEVSQMFGELIGL